MFFYGVKVVLGDDLELFVLVCENKKMGFLNEMFVGGLCLNVVNVAVGK